MDSILILEWFHFADTDLALAKHALSMHPKPLEATCYHCQQSAEKYLKGYLVYRGNSVPPKIRPAVFQMSAKRCICVKATDMNDSNPHNSKKNS